MSLDADPSTLFHRNTLKQNALHLAADWPTGLTALLSRGASPLVNDLDIIGYSPLHHSVHHGCIAAIEILLEADSAIDTRILADALDSVKPVGFKILVQGLTQRSLRLRELAEQRLTQEVSENLGCRANPLSDTTFIYSTFMALKAASVSIPASLDFSSFSPRNSLARSIFDLGVVSDVHAAELLHEAGFRFDIEETNHNKWIAKKDIQKSMDLLVWIKSKVQKVAAFTICVSAL